MQWYCDRLDSSHALASAVSTNTNERFSQSVYSHETQTCIVTQPKYTKRMLSTI